ncbi:hypothetical protein [Nostoc sp.]
MVRPTFLFAIPTVNFSTRRSANANALNQSSYISDVYDGLRLRLTLKTAATILAILAIALILS